MARRKAEKKKMEVVIISSFKKIKKKMLKKWLIFKKIITMEDTPIATIWEASQAHMRGNLTGLTSKKQEKTRQL